MSESPPAHPLHDKDKGQLFKSSNKTKNCSPPSSAYAPGPRILDSFQAKAEKQKIVVVAPKVLLWKVGDLLL